MKRGEEKKKYFNSLSPFHPSMGSSYSSNDNSTVDASPPAEPEEKKKKRTIQIKHVDWQAKEAKKAMMEIREITKDWKHVPWWIEIDWDNGPNNTDDSLPFQDIGKITQHLQTIIKYITNDKITRIEDVGDEITPNENGGGEGVISWHWRCFEKGE